MGDWAAAGYSGGGQLVAADLIIFIRMLIFYCQILVVLHKKLCAPKIEEVPVSILRFVKGVLSIRSSTMSLTTLILCQIVLKYMI